MFKEIAIIQGHTMCMRLQVHPSDGIVQVINVPHVKSAVCDVSRGLSTVCLPDVIRSMFNCGPC